MVYITTYFEDREILGSKLGGENSLLREHDEICIFAPFREVGERARHEEMYICMKGTWPVGL